ncbi:unnamed protein product, partial [Thlaspi arvense]
KGSSNTRKTRSRESEEEAGRGDPTGEESGRGSGDTASGFGGLRLEGIVGIAEDSDGEGDISLEPGVGNRGKVSGDIAGGEAEKLQGEGASGKNEGAADMSERRVKAVHRDTVMVTMNRSLSLGCFENVCERPLEVYGQFKGSRDSLIDLRADITAFHFPSKSDTEIYVKTFCSRFLLCFSSLHSSEHK